MGSVASPIPIAPVADIVLLDLDLAAGMSGTDVCKQCAPAPVCRVSMVTAPDSEIDRWWAWAGAYDYVTKSPNSSS